MWAYTYHDSSCGIKKRKSSNGKARWVRVNVNWFSISIMIDWAGQNNLCVCVCVIFQRCNYNFINGFSWLPLYISVRVCCGVLFLLLICYCCRTKAFAKSFTSTYCCWWVREERKKAIFLIEALHITIWRHSIACAMNFCISISRNILFVFVFVREVLFRAVKLEPSFLMHVCLCVCECLFVC